ncbi:DNA cytosine methyltransferase [Shinella zoogloeoides]
MRVVELFCGAGGMSLGLKQAGFKIVGAYDNMKAAVDTYRANLGDHVHQVDLSNILTVVPRILAERPDMIVGGPPCQDYSIAGNRVEDKNARLTLAFAITIVTCRPEWFVMENVVQAARSTNWREAKDVLKKAGYGISESKVKFQYHDVPQARKRLIVVGRLGERDGFMSSAIAAKASETPMSLRDGLVTNGNLKGCFYLKAPPELTALLRGGHVYTRPLMKGRAVRSVDEPYATLTRTSGEPPSARLRAKYQANPRDSAPLEKAAVMDQKYLSMVQGFPPDWTWVSRSRRQTMVMIANAVPPPAAKRIGEVIRSRAQGWSAPALEGRFLQWLLKEKRFRKATACNIMSNVRRARAFLGGRTFADPALELATLEATPDFAALGSQVRSDLRRGLALYVEYLDNQHRRRGIGSLSVQPKLLQRPQPFNFDVMATL